MVPFHQGNRSSINIGYVAAVVLSKIASRLNSESIVGLAGMMTQSNRAWKTDDNELTLMGTLLCQLHHD